jgi:hypothetical protein
MNFETSNLQNPLFHIWQIKYHKILLGLLIDEKFQLFPLWSLGIRPKNVPKISAHNPQSPYCQTIL